MTEGVVFFGNTVQWQPRIVSDRVTVSDSDSARPEHVTRDLMQRRKQLCEMLQLQPYYGIAVY